MGLLFLTLPLSVAAAAIQQLEGFDVVSGHPVLEKFGQKSESKFTVLVFLSAKCPCSNSHISQLRELAKKYPQFKFFGAHSNGDEAPTDARQYFTGANLSFPVLSDPRAKLADQFKAFKTPHAFILNAAGETVYQGGVTNSSNASSATQFFLSDALTDIANNREVRIKEGRTLGCVITRAGEKNVF